LVTVQKRLAYWGKSIFMYHRLTLRADVRNSVIASDVGIAGPAPSTVTAKAPAAFAKVRASSIVFPRASAVAKAPQNASPAAVVSTTLTG
jgi:hypothetical protein